MTKEEIREKLAAPFTTIGPDGKTYPAHKWRAQQAKEYGAMCVPYIDSRQVVSRLNDVLGLDGWSNNLIEMTGKGLICEIVAIIDGKEISKSNVGVETDVQKEKGQASDAIKRAASAFEVGAYLYDMEPVKLKAKKHTNDKYYPATDDGKILFTGDALSSYINMKNPLRAKLTEIWSSISKENQPKIEKEFKAIWEALTN